MSRAHVSLTCNLVVAYIFCVRSARDPVSESFAALGDPTRRKIVETLVVDGPATVRDLTAGLPVSRQAVTKHLEILERAGLTRTRREGRERITELAPEPFETARRWFASYDRFWGDALEKLRENVEGEESTDEKR